MVHTHLLVFFAPGLADSRSRSFATRLAPWNSARRAAAAPLCCWTFRRRSCDPGGESLKPWRQFGPCLNKKYMTSPNKMNRIYRWIYSSLFGSIRGMSSIDVHRMPVSSSQLWTNPCYCRFGQAGGWSAVKDQPGTKWVLKCGQFTVLFTFNGR